jgi:hypothetical protein
MRKSTLVSNCQRHERWANARIESSTFLNDSFSWAFFAEALEIREQTFSATPIPLYPFKFAIPLAGALLLLQGIVEIIRCLICLRDGEWPSREEDVEEVDVEKLKQMVHVKDEDILAVDQVVVAQQHKPS